MKFVVAVVMALAVALPAASMARGQLSLSAIWAVREDGSMRQAVAVIPPGVVLDRTRERVALNTDDGLVVVGLAAGTRVLFPDTKVGVGSAEFSPSGDLIAFTAWADGSYGLYVGRTDATAVRRVDLSASPAAWLRDGESIVFASGLGGKRADLVAARFDGSGRRVLVRSGVAVFFRPSVSPDGLSVAYDCVNEQGGGFCIVRGRTTRRYPRGGLDPLWSPTGRRVATTVTGDLNSGLDVVDVATGARHVVAPIPDLIGVDYTPLAWSPDGRRLLYQRTCGAGLRPPQCVTAAYTRTIATGRNRRLSVDGLRWTLAQWHSGTITYVTQP